MWPNLIWLLIQRDHMARNVAFHYSSFFDGKNYLFWSRAPIKGNDFSPTVKMFTTSEHLNPYLSLKWMWWLVLVSGVNKVPDYPTPVDVCTPCNYCLFTVLWVWAWCEWRTSMDRDPRSVLWYPNSSILRILFHCSIMQQHHPMLKTMCNALSVFFLIFVSLIFYIGPLVYRDIEFLTVPSKA